MLFRSRRLVKTEDLNPRGTLFGGKCMQWIDEEAAIFAMCQLETKNVVTKLISEINFLAPGRIGDVIEFGMEVTHIGKTSLTFRCEVRNKDTKSTIVNIDKMVFVNVDESCSATPHGITEIKE
jgi:acyl-CoA hydrolase